VRRDLDRVAGFRARILDALVASGLFGVASVVDALLTLGASVLNAILDRVLAGVRDALGERVAVDLRLFASVLDAFGEFVSADVELEA